MYILLLLALSVNSGECDINTQRFMLCATTNEPRSVIHDFVFSKDEHDACNYILHRNEQRKELINRLRMHIAVIDFLQITEIFMPWFDTKEFREYYVKEHMRKTSRMMDDAYRWTIYSSM